jgi:hypothetical protein
MELDETSRKTVNKQSHKKEPNDEEDEETHIHTEIKQPI